MIDVLLTATDLANAADILPQSQVVILDILRATTTITTALHNGAKEIRLFDSLDAVRNAKTSRLKSQDSGPIVTAGETLCLKPDDFDLGNSPREFTTEKIGGAIVLLSTTNGTRAAVSARSAKTMYAASLLNATATALALAQNIDSEGGHTLLICSGTKGKLALEDTLGAGAILFSLLAHTYRADLPFTDNAWLAYHAFSAVQQRLPAALRLGQGTINIIDAGLEDDIDHCARLNTMPLVATINPSTLTVTRANEPPR
ncbi:MAG TPA: 2-phosphosulfolactate phosphatase [Phycisphaerae bacterium]|nr:2-phosphosulfolactate phosphatase [Phycisphaerae bacterium]